MDEVMVKSMTGGDPLIARGLYENQYTEFVPTHKMFVVGNHKPVILGTDEGIWRRPLLIPFTITIPPAYRKPMEEVLDCFKAERAGMLNWMLEGWRRFASGGLAVPSCVQQATDQYRSEQDVLGGFLDECCEKSDDCTISHREFYAEYKTSADDNGYTPLGTRLLISILEGKGFQRANPPTNMLGWRGVRIPERRHDAI